MLQLLKPFWLVIMKYGAIVGGAFLFWLQARKSGEATIKQQNVENTLKAVEANNEIKDNVSNLNDSKYNSLLKKWTRD